MQCYLFFGGNQDGLNIPAPSGAESVQLPSGVTDKETYIRSTLSLGDVSITIYIHESLTAGQVLERLISNYKA